MARTYRTRLEVLHDFLDASRRASRKTRIIGLANLNPSYFESYAQFCLDHHLIEVTSDGYRPTELADQVLVAIRRILSKTAELDGAIRSLNVVLRQDGDADLPRTAMRLYPPDAWQEILLHSVPRLTLPRSGVPVRGSGSAREIRSTPGSPEHVDEGARLPRPRAAGGRWRETPEALP